MEVLASKIAELLDISVQGAIDLYPVIKSQYVWYRVLSGVSMWSAILGFVSLASMLIALAVEDETSKYVWDTEEISEEWKAINKVVVVSILAFVLFIIITITANLARPFLAPDILLIKDFLG